MDGPYTAFVVNSDGHLLYAYAKVDDLTVAIEVAKSSLAKMEEAEYAVVIENCVAKQGATITVGVAFRWHGKKGAIPP